MTYVRTRLRRRRMEGLSFKRREVWVSSGSLGARDSREVCAKEWGDAQRGDVPAMCCMTPLNWMEPLIVSSTTGRELKLVSNQTETDVGRRRTSLFYRVVLGEDVEHEGVVAEGYTHIHMPVSVCRFAQSMV